MGNGLQVAGGKKINLEVYPIAVINEDYSQEGGAMVCLCSHRLGERRQANSSTKASRRRAHQRDCLTDYFSPLTASICFLIRFSIIVISINLPLYLFD